jgi:hypothetical protein
MYILRRRLRRRRRREKKNRVYLAICPLFGRMSPGSRSLWTSKPDRLTPSFMCIYQKGTKSWRYVNGHWGVRHTTRARAAVTHGTSGDTIFRI